MTIGKLRALVFAGWIALALTAVAGGQILPASLRIVVLGSSTAAGEGTSTRDSAWVWRYAAELRTMSSAYDVINLARGGYTSYHLQASGFVPPNGRPDPDTSRNITKALSLLPDAIILNLPSNDAVWDMSILEQIANFEHIAAEAAAAGVQIWVTTTQPRNLSEARKQNLATMRDWIRGTYGERSVDFWTGLANDDGGILPWADAGDGVHLNDAGHALLADRIREARIPETIASTTTIAARMSAPPPVVEIYPQPANDQLSVRIRLATPGTLTFIMYDMLGRRVRDVHRGSSPGAEVNLSFQTTHLAAGPYLWVLQSNGCIISGRLIVGG
jgi:lysophospholipase L1-like esterase